MKKTTTILTACTVALCASSAMADTAVNIFGYASGSPATFDNASGAFPVVTEILSVPSVTVNGYSYGAATGTFLAADDTGSLEIYSTPAATYTPTVGDAITVSGTYAPFHQVPEIGTITSVTKESTGNAAPIAQPLVTTVSGIDLATLPQSVAGQYLQIDSATITGQTPGETFGTADLTLTITDSSGTEELFYYPHDFSVANQNLFGETIPTGPVDIQGIAAVFTSGATITPEFYPIQILPAPEPSSIALAVVGGAAVLMGLRRRK